MKLKIAFQMDPISDVDINGDTSFRLAEEGQKRGHEIYYFNPESLVYDGGNINAYCQKVEINRESATVISLQKEQIIDLSKEVDIVFLRQDPPFDMLYITTTFLLERLKGKTLVLNDPYWVRNSPEKLLVLDFLDLMPPTVITRSLKSIVEFRNRYKDIILKPLYGNGGTGVFRLVEGDKNLNVFFETFVNNSREPIIVQQFLPDVSNGDKRIILVDGEPIGAINRIPPQDDIRSNMHVGGSPAKSNLTARDTEICNRLSAVLKKKNLFFVGIDVIGQHLTEINVTSPTGLQELERFENKNYAQIIWEGVEKKWKSEQ
ncbi:glutathione synthase [Paracoccaceae bacterium]|nr:glutathione synthase [Paracoccaceae bacterium]